MRRRGVGRYVGVFLRVHMQLSGNYMCDARMLLLKFQESNSDIFFSCVCVYLVVVYRI